MDLEQFGKSLDAKLSLAIGKIEALTISQLDSNGRVAAVLLAGTDGSAALTGPQLRQIVGYDRLRSTWFSVTTVSDGQCLFTGRGWGHGLGMCQRGAIALARREPPVSYQEILAHYYTGTQIVAFSPALLRPAAMASR